MTLRLNGELMMGEMEGLGRELNAHYIRHLQGSQLQFLNDASISRRFAVVAGGTQFITLARWSCFGSRRIRRVRFP